MSTETRTNVEALIDELHRSAAREIALAVEWKANYPWRLHDVPRAKERAEEYLLAARHLMGEL
jgi:predicted nucleic acid-binding protein